MTFCSTGVPDCIDIRWAFSWWFICITRTQYALPLFLLGWVSRFWLVFLGCFTRQYLKWLSWNCTICGWWFHTFLLHCYISIWGPPSITAKIRRLFIAENCTSMWNDSLMKGVVDEVCIKICAVKLCWSHSWSSLAASWFTTHQIPSARKRFTWQVTSLSGETLLSLEQVKLTCTCDLSLVGLDDQCPAFPGISPQRRPGTETVTNPKQIIFLMFNNR